MHLQDPCTQEPVSAHLEEDYPTPKQGLPVSLHTSFMGMGVSQDDHQAHHVHTPGTGEPQTKHRNVSEAQCKVSNSGNSLAGIHFIITVSRHTARVC